MLDDCKSYLSPGTSGWQTGIVIWRSRASSQALVMASCHQEPLSSVQGEGQKSTTQHMSRS